MTMHATVLEVCDSNLLVCDHCTKQEVVVHTDSCCHFCPGDKICICYNGIMTMSIPPQITATCIKFISCCRCRHHHC